MLHPADPLLQALETRWQATLYTGEVEPQTSQGRFRAAPKPQTRAAPVR